MYKNKKIVAESNNFILNSFVLKIRNGMILEYIFDIYYTEMDS